MAWRSVRPGCPDSIHHSTNAKIAPIATDASASIAYWLAGLNSLARRFRL